MTRLQATAVRTTLFADYGKQVHTQLLRSINSHPQLHDNHVSGNLAQLSHAIIYGLVFVRIAVLDQSRRVFRSSGRNYILVHYVNQRCQSQLRNSL